MGAEAAVLAAAAIGAGASIYSAQQAAKGPKLPQPKMPLAPKLPNTAQAAASTARGDLLARTAGGTILSNQRANQALADGANTTRKTLLGV